MLNKIRNKFIKKYITENYKHRLSPKDLETAIKKATSKYSGIYTISKKNLGESIRSSHVNEVFEEIFLDLNTVFKSLEIVNTTVEKTLITTLKNGIKISKNIDTINQKVNDYMRYINSRANPICILEEFKNKNNFERNLDYFCERYGTNVGVFTTNVLDKDTESLILPKTRSSNMCQYDKGVVAANVYINKQFGANNKDIELSEKTLNNIIIPNRTLTWKETIQTDDPFKIEKETIDYHIDSGCLCEIVIDFESVSSINEIVIIPDTNFPLDLLCVRYTLASDDTGIKTLIGDSIYSKTLKGNSLEHTLTYRFENTIVKKLYLTFNQQNFIRSAFMYNSTNRLRNNVLHALNSKNKNSLALDKNIIFKPNYLDMEKQSPTELLINELVEVNEDMNFENLLFLSKGKDVKAIKYSYEYGINTITANNNEFDRTGIFTSGLIKCGNIKNISISTTEGHCYDKDNKKITDIEYYVSCSLTPKWHDWVPILPKNIERIESELLQIYDDLCYLRFPAKYLNDVYLDGDALIRDVDYWVKTNDLEEIIAIEIPNFDFVSTYTVSYIPVETSSEIDFTSNRQVTSKEVFNCNNNSYLKLKNNIYISSYLQKEIDDIYIRIINADTGKTIASDKNGVENVTDPYSPFNSYKNFDDKSSSFQYYTYKNYIYFNKNLGQNIKIEVTYRHYANNVRVKAILRRNHKSYKHLTPTVSDIKYEVISGD